MSYTCEAAPEGAAAPGHIDAMNAELTALADDAYHLLMRLESVADHLYGSEPAAMAACEEPPEGSSALSAMTCRMIRLRDTLDLVRREVERLERL